MSIEEIARFAGIKGLNVVGTGDFTHPDWIRELQNDLAEESNAGLFKPARTTNQTCFMITGEVSTIFTFRGETKKIHHVILTPSFETAVQINDRLASYGDLRSDGRPMLEMSAPQLVEEVMAVSQWNEVIPAHAWTPWFSLFGAFSGFDGMEDCYQDMTRHIHALETGLSSDPPMNWRLEALDKYTLVSNSDSHSYWPWRIGREANVLNLKIPTYNEIIDAIRAKDPERFEFTIETNPAYGKYHWTGHRNCKVSMPPQEAIKFNNLCPVCRRRLTKGVEQRVEELADRPVGFKPSKAIGYMHLLPLSEVVAAVLDASSPSLENVWQIYNTLIARFGNEYAVLIDASVEEMAQVIDPKIAEAIVRVRAGEARVTPGYDGVYGQLVFFDEEEPEKKRSSTVPQRSLTEWV
ncbi:MAG: endonuclease Q family protein [Candidatus Bathyarchaeia archaeon]